MGLKDDEKNDRAMMWAHVANQIASDKAREFLKSELQKIGDEIDNRFKSRGNP